MDSELMAAVDNQNIYPVNKNKPENFVYAMDFGCTSPGDY